MAWGAIRTLIGDGKYRRFQEDGYDLDLVYVTPRLIGMSAPAAGFVESTFRNDIAKLQQFLEERHSNHYKVYNLCRERVDDLDHWEHVSADAEWFPVDDHNPCRLEQLQDFCQSVSEHLAEDGENVAVVHCKAGKGRTGMFMSTFLLHSGDCSTADEALSAFASKRMKAGLRGVTVPSQLRYVRYYEQMLQSRWAAPPMQTLQLTSVRMLVAPDFSGRLEKDGCQPYFKVNTWKPDESGGFSLTLLYNHRKHVDKVKRVDAGTPCVDLDCEASAPSVRGHVQVALYTEHPGWPNEEMCHIWLHTGFFRPGILKFAKDDIDMAHKDKRSTNFPDNFEVHLTFAAPPPRGAA